ncbi:tRNA 2-selenouridine(34) synthase MnmH [Paenibacillus sp. N1-5-1-14]|uniref:tRNA 2-selenouridine(34) synthase MnmH n=1 Tax=Paenibacillus radicibacter TaxID=2972488 RepID=UPI00215951AE|nr:tRNA 2-selenouridine(34) synthase MnmH [Paenibacillus radicibacter]MCR8643832.1 tRNA 2-selenouridine(34) synthase MnmH [Paenibacillus radicibacter]
MFQDIRIEELLEQRKKQDMTLIDVRSRSEWEEFTIPGAINIPFFDDEERKEIGTIYKQVSIQKAKERGLEIISAKLPSFIKQFAAIPGRKVVFCWRGGMRSKTTATLLSLMDIHVSRLAGGIRSYRQWVVSTLESYEMKPKCVVLGGNTGTGKTAILEQLEDEGYPVLNLEALSGHRGSIFGAIGLHPHNQKVFDALLVEALLQHQDSPYVIVEAESKRLGKVVIPQFLMDAKEQGVQLLIDIPVAERVLNIMKDYDPAAHKEACMDAFAHIQKRIHTPIAATIESSLLTGRYPQAIELLLEHYYDPRYEHAGEHYMQAPTVIQASDTEEVLRQVISQIKLL